MARSGSGPRRTAARPAPRRSSAPACRSSRGRAGQPQRATADARCAGATRARSPPPSFGSCRPRGLSSRRTARVQLDSTPDRAHPRLTPAPLDRDQDTAGRTPQSGLTFGSVCQPAAVRRERRPSSLQWGVCHSGCTLAFPSSKVMSMHVTAPNCRQRPPVACQGRRIEGPGPGQEHARRRGAVGGLCRDSPPAARGPVEDEVPPVRCPRKRDHLPVHEQGRERRAVQVVEPEADFRQAPHRHRQSPAVGRDAHNGRVVLDALPGAERRARGDRR